jgi:hypothetical protein
MSKRQKVIVSVDDPFADFEQLASQIATLQAMSDENLLDDGELERFFGLILPAQHAALDVERAKAKAVGRSLSHAEFQAVSIKAFVGAAGDAAREVWGATIGELIDGRKAQ